MNSAGYIYTFVYMYSKYMYFGRTYILNFCRFGDGDGDDYVEKLSIHFDQLFCFKYIRFWIYSFFGYIIFWIYLFLDISLFGYIIFGKYLNSRYILI